MKKFLKIRWFLFLFVMLAIWRNWPRNQEPSVAMIQPDALEVPSPPSSPPPSPLLSPVASHFRHKHKHPPRHHLSQFKATVEPSPTAEFSPSPEASPEAAPSPTPKARQAASVLETVAFKSEEEVLANLGDPDEKFEHEDRVSWYYNRPALSRQGKPVCPEVEFFEGEARVVIMWPPDKMKELISTARRLKSEGGIPQKGPQTFTFVDSFKYLGVGTRQDVVLEDLGEPDSKVNVDGNEEWDYDTLIVENGTSRRLAVIFKDGKVLEVQGR
jgi:hypothetical protein